MPRTQPLPLPSWKSVSSREEGEVKAAVVSKEVQERLRLLLGAEPGAMLAPPLRWVTCCLKALQLDDLVPLPGERGEGVTPAPLEAGCGTESRRPAAGRP